MPRSFLIVDAHNVIFAHPDLAGRHHRGPAGAREQLLRILERHQDATGTRVVVVFDGGRGDRQPAGELSGAAGVQVFYPQAGQTADAIIERLVVKYAGVHRITVATNDGLVRTAAVAAGASTISAESLFEEIGAGEADLRGTMDRLRRKN
jgi:predicted RNA-binding protein with PIN domain